MDKNDLLKKMAADYKEILKNVSGKLKEIEDFAKVEGVSLDVKNEEKNIQIPQQDSSPQTSIKKEFEKQRQTMIERMEKIREDSKKQMQLAMEESNKMRSSVLTMPEIPEMPTMPTMPEVPVQIPEASVDPVLEVTEHILSDIVEPNINSEDVAKKSE